MYNGNLIVAGNFVTAGGIPAVGIAKWDGTSWSNLGMGIDINSNLNLKVTALAVYNGELYAGGVFTMAGGVIANRIAKWNGTAWSSVGIGPSGNAGLGVYSLIVFNGELYAGGVFTSMDGIPANGIAKWNGTIWSAVDSGVTSTNYRGVYSLAVSNSILYAGGYFTTAGGIPANHIAKWNGTIWDSLGSGTNGSMVAALAEYNSELYLGGAFSIAGGSTANKVAKWNGSSFAPVGTGMSGGSPSIVVYSLATFNGSLYAGGAFTMASGNIVNNIAKWPSSITNVENSSVTKNTIIYPNPNNGTFTITQNNTNKTEIEINNILGELIYKANTANLQTSIDLSNQPKGIYFVKTTDTNRSVTNKKIVIQ
jgi:hypothetical protein